MAPKKAADTKVSAPPSESPEKEVMEEANAEDLKAPSKATVPQKASTHPSTMEMVKEALKELDSRKGVSAQAVRTFIKEKYPTVDGTRIKFMVRRALVKGLDSGTFVRPPNSNTTGAQGRFRLVVGKKAKPAQKAKEAKENSNPNVGKEKGTGTGKTKPAKKAKPAAETGKKKTKNASASKVAPAKKPKAKKATSEEPEPNAQKTSKDEEVESGKTAAKKGGKRKAPKTEEEVAAAPKKKAGSKTEAGGKKAARKASGDGEEGAAAAPKAPGRKGKKVAEK